MGGVSKIFFSTFFNFKKKKIGQCAISSTGMTFVFAYISHKWSKMAKNSFFGGLPFVKKNKKYPQKKYFSKFENMLLSEIKFRREACFRILKNIFLGALFVFFTKGNPPKKHPNLGPPGPYFEAPHDFTGP